MSDRLPPLTALRAFEAAARHLSFQNAADELAVTPAALSYQIKNLEAHLGAPLFTRLNRAVALTEAGKTLLPGTSDGFEQLRAAWRATQRLTDDTKLTITAGPAFTAKWLAPRMFRFAQANPDIEMRFAATLKVMDFTRDDVDVAIRFGLGGDEGYYSEPLLRGWLTPMMTPTLAEGVKTAEDLAKLPLIHDDSMTFLKRVPNWGEWFAAAGLPDVDTSHGLRFSQADHAVDAALEGAGVVLGRLSVTERYLGNGRLVAPFALSLTTPAHYRFVCPAGTETRPAVKRFHDWIYGEMAEIDHFAEGRDIRMIE
ncbi:LysR family glycine cleavage system transcriptional activator [Rubricella aquisinus]|uniref:LysR family glycine cleavage system transcriptional activator n=1 Tax=Rubricella aquisinus TaxID=2028108 RepID=A0A840WM20_9RHOB|nr:transcriptional regulator GcvA [Rubricella aquisinus]MBB5515173.1 LysR family glycine cleavage system transcriptional activator [Rubricella aquisinus]